MKKYTDSVFSLLRVTILKDKDTRESKGVAFVLFLDRQTAQKAAAAVNRKQVLIITIKRPYTHGKQ